MFGSSLNGDAPKHPHFLQLIADLEYLVFVEDLAEYRYEIVNNPLVLLSDAHINVQFTKANFKVIRIAFLSTSIAPPSCCDAPPSGPRDRDQCAFLCSSG